MSDWIETRFNKLDDKLENVASDVSDMKSIQIAQAKDIAHHISRTDALQDIVTPMAKRHQQMVGVLKFVAFLISLGGLLKLVEYLKS